MADEADIGNELAQIALDEQRKAKKPAPTLQPKGQCYNPDCEEPFDDNSDGTASVKLFCNPECAGAFQKIIERKSR